MKINRMETLGIKCEPSLGKSMGGLGTLNFQLYFCRLRTPLCYSCRWTSPSTGKNTFGFYYYFYAYGYSHKIP